MSTLSESDLRVPDIVGELVGWRAWELVGDAYFPRLMSAVQKASSVGAQAIWPTNRWFMATCLREPAHNEPGAGIPVERCSCGIYAAKTLEQLSGLGYAAYYDVANAVVGEVAFAGKVIEGSQGWRAEKARIKRLWVPHRTWRYMEPLSSAYGVEVGLARMLGGQIRLTEER